MYLTVFVEPGPAGFRATSGGPLVLSADGPTADAAVAAVQAQYTARLAAGGEVRAVVVPPAAAADPPFRPGSATAILAVLDRLGPPSDWTEYDAAVQEYRREHNTVPDDD